MPPTRKPGNSLFRIGVDAWWMDTTEPETEGREDNEMVTNRVAIGSGARYANLFPLFTAGAVHDGQRAESDRKRVSFSPGRRLRVRSGML